MTPAPPRDIVSAVRAELAVPGRYHLTLPSAHRSLVRQFWDWAGARIQQFWESLTRHVTIPRSGMIVLGDALVVVCGLLVVFAVVRLTLQLEVERAGRHDAVPLDAPRNAQSYAVAAAKAAAGGDYTRAVRLLFIAAVTLLDLRGVVRDERGATINDLRREVRARDEALEGPFLEIARAYTSAAYAERPLDAQTWQHAQHAYARLKEHSPA